MTKETLKELEEKLEKYGRLNSTQVENTFGRFSDNPWKLYFKRVKSLEAKIKRRKSKIEKN